MRKILVFWGLFLGFLTVEAGAVVNLGIKKVTEKISFPLLCLDSVGIDALPDSAHVFTYLDAGSAAQFTNRNTTYPFDGSNPDVLGIDTVKIYDDTTYWFSDVIGDIDGSPTPPTYTLAIDVVLYTETPGIATHNRAIVQVIADSLNEATSGITAASKIMDSLADRPDIASGFASTLWYGEINEVSPNVGSFIVQGIGSGRVALDLGKADDFYSRMTLIMISGTQRGERSVVRNWINSSNTLSIDDLPSVPSDNDSFVVLQDNMHLLASLAEFVGAPCDTSTQILYPLGAAPKDSVRIYCGEGADTVYVRTVYFAKNGGIVDTVRSVAEAEPG